MGTTGSSNAASAPAARLRERGEETFIYGTGESYTNENIRQRTSTGAFDVGEEPRLQGPSPCATLRDGEWSQRPSAPSLSNLRPPRPETLLTYAAQMTGWQTAEGHGPSFSQQHQEAMELSRTISQLAMANQQLATAHTATLAHLEALYAELTRERDWRIRSSSDEALKRRLETEPEDEDEEERRRMELRIDRLENLLTEDTWQTRQKHLRQEEDRKLRSRVERLESLAKARGLEDEGQKCAIASRPVDNSLITDGGVQDRLLISTDVPECESRSQLSASRGAEVRTRSVQTMFSMFDEQTSHSRSSDETDRSNLHLEKSDEAMVEDEEGITARMEATRLMEELERLKAERLEYRRVNDRLANELDDQKAMVEQLTKNDEESKAGHEQVVSRLREHGAEYDNLMAKFDVSKKEAERLMMEIDASNLQRDTAAARISSLEQDLQKSLLEKEQIKNLESQKTAKLEAQLSEEVSVKTKQMKALEDALDEIQRLKETIKTERQNDDNGASKDDIGPAEFIDDPQESPPAECTANIDDFKKELTLKREARQRAIAAVSSEMERLRRELDAEKEAHSETSKVLDLLRSAQSDQETGEANGSAKKRGAEEQKPDEHELAMKRAEAQRLTNVLKVSDELRNDIRFQIEKVDDLRYHLETDPEHHRYRIRCLTDVTNRTRESLFARERRANELKNHLAQILARLGDRSFLDLKDDVGSECERQLESIHGMKCLYNERLKVLTELRDAAVKELADAKERLDHSLKKSECLEEDLRKADEKIDAQASEITNLESQLGLTKADCRDLQNQMSLINGLFTQMLLGASSADMDLDRLTQLLQENHDLISDMAREESTEAAALPKLLLDLVEQVEGSKGIQKRVDGENGTDGDTEKKEDDLQQEDIAHNLPKVWRVLLELLSCHAEGTPSASAASSSDPNSCYKSVDTPAGPRLVISVSKTYIRLKELILEKKHLEKEMNRMKQLNTHLESKLGEQEKRLSTVSAELSKTWTIVDRMQAQHQQLHTHEKILRYELQQKRKMLQELKQELEYCREKWESARQKNTNTELEWRSLRREFAARKALAVHDSFNNSAESGFSDERGDDTDEEDEAVEGRIRLGPRRKPRKESPRAPSPDTESEQPTDTELSEPKTGSSTTLEQRTPTPETDAELDEAEVAEPSPIIESSTPEAPAIPESPQESLDPLDQALTNVIQNLIRIDEEPGSIFDRLSNEAEATKTDVDSVPSKDSATTDSGLESKTSDDSEPLKTNEMLCTSSSITDDSQKTVDTDGEKAKIEEPPKPSVSHVPVVTSPASTPVFSIGPFPSSAMTPSTVKNVQFIDPPPVDRSNRFFAPVFGTPFPEQRFDASFSSPSDSAGSGQETDAKGLEKRAAKSAESFVDSDNVSVDSSSSLETVKEFSTVESAPACSHVEPPKREASSSEAAPSRPLENKVPTKTRTPEEALAAREDRLKRLEEQAKWLMNKMNATSRRGSALSTRLEELHEAYGEPPVPPPMPDVLPSRRLRTNLTDLPRQIPEPPSSEATENTEKPISSDRSNESVP